MCLCHTKFLISHLFLPQYIINNFKRIFFILFNVEQVLRNFLQLFLHEYIFQKKILFYRLNFWK